MKRPFRKISLLIVAVLCISLGAFAVTEDINQIAERADMLYVQKRYSEAFPLMKQAAEGGDVISMFNLGTMYYEGQGTSKSIRDARRWWKEAAIRGDSFAKECLNRLDEKRELDFQEEQQAAQIEKNHNDNNLLFMKQVIIQNLLSNLVYVAGGTFKMGATINQGWDANKDEKPEHKVELSSFYIGKYEVTQAEWCALMDSNPSNFKGDDLPVENVSWEDCQEFIKKLNQLTGKNFRLPTEAEWEYAARGGDKNKNYKYSGNNNINKVAWYMKNSDGKTHNVGEKSPNSIGLFDMSGNVWEWCSDWYVSDYYKTSPSSNPVGPNFGYERLCRGGAWNCDDKSCRVSTRSSNAPDFRCSYIGFRLAL